MTAAGPTLLLGPLLRHVGTHDATVWVETDRACTVEILGHAQPTFEVAGHHYALVCIEGLAAGSTTAYDVRLDGALVWPEPGDPRPRPRIRTFDPDAPLRLVFGSCRYARPDAVRGDRHFHTDALDAFAKRMASLDAESWPDALLLLGDQVYADETSPQTQERIRQRRSVDQPPGTQVKDFEEYTWLYHESWTDPDVRWLLSTLPSSMIFDDHDIADDWNTSAAWRHDMQATSWWEERVIGGLASYWVYQHIGNLAPQALAKDALYQQVRGSGADCWPLLRDFAAAADREADGEKGARWSYRRDLGPVRLLVIDSRCGRVLETGHRSMVGESEFAWIEEQVAGDYDHLLVGTSLPWLLPRALHDVEAWNEVLADGARGPLLARWAEAWRRALDLEHWASFRRSFDRLGELFAAVTRRERPPATICVLSGDVHHAYAARAFLPRAGSGAVWQLTCSPVHNYVPAVMRWAFRVAWSQGAEAVMRLLLRVLSKVPHQPLTWRRVAGPYYGNAIATLTVEGPRAYVLFEQSGTDGAGQPALTPVGRPLSLNA